MKFLCLHGAIGSSKSFSIQLAPLEEELKETNISFEYVDGSEPVKPPEGFETYFGIGPHYRWIDENGLAHQGMLDRVRRLPMAETPEDVIRALGLGYEDCEPDEVVMRSWRNTLDVLYRKLEDHPDISGIIGYSEGACVAATFVLDEIARYQESGRRRQITCAIFICGWPPLGPDRRPVLSDESKLTIDIPTLHVLGANDPYKDGSIALYNVCDGVTAEMFDVAKGHTIPRSGLVITELGQAVQTLAALAEEYAVQEDCFGRCT